MSKKKLVASLLITAAVICQPISVLADAAPDGKTDASQTEAAQNGAWEAWCTEWDTIKSDWTTVSIAPGADETSMRFAWYSKADENVTFTYGKSSDLSDGQQAEITSETAQEGYKSNKVVLNNLEPGVTYYYQVTGKAVASFTTDSDTSSFSFIFIGDPQIGSSNESKNDAGSDAFEIAQSESVRNDSFNWNYTLERAMAKSNNAASFVLSAGDQIQSNADDDPNYVEDETIVSPISEIEYAGYLSPDLLQSLPVATTVGNHDADNANYLMHFNPANMNTLGSNGVVGGDYYFTYGDVLFMMLNTQDTNVAEHKQFIEETVAANQDCKWKIVTLHQDIYGSAEHSNEPEIVNLRYSLTPIFEANDIDMVLTGHDHAYSRSNMMLADESKAISYSDDAFDDMLDRDVDVGEDTSTRYEAPANINDNTTDPDEQTYLSYLNQIMDTDLVEQVTTGQEGVINSDGILYMTAGSSSGSKYYDLVPRQQSYIASRWQQDVPTYTVVDVSDASITLNTYRTDTDEPIDTTFTMVKSASQADLSALIEQAQALSADQYTDESFAALTAALDGAIAVNTDISASETDISNAYTALKTAIDNLVPIQTQPSIDQNIPSTVPNTNDTASGVNVKPSEENINTGVEADYTAIVVAGAVIVFAVGGSVLYFRKRKVK